MRSSWWNEKVLNTLVWHLLVNFYRRDYTLSVWHVSLRWRVSVYIAVCRRTVWLQKAIQSVFGAVSAKANPKRHKYSVLHMHTRNRPSWCRCVLYLGRVYTFVVLWFQSTWQCWSEPLNMQLSESGMFFLKTFVRHCFINRGVTEFYHTNVCILTISNVCVVAKMTQCKRHNVNTNVNICVYIAV